MDPVQLGGVGIALLVAYRALLILEKMVSKRQQARDTTPPNCVPTEKCEDYRERTAATIADMDRRISDKLDGITRQLGKIDTAVVSAIAAHERRYHTEITGVHDIRG